MSRTGRKSGAGWSQGQCVAPLYQSRTRRVWTIIFPESSQEKPASGLISLSACMPEQPQVLAKRGFPAAAIQNRVVPGSRFRSFLDMCPEAGIGVLLQAITRPWSPPITHPYAKRQLGLPSDSRHAGGPSSASSATRVFYN